MKGIRVNMSWSCACGASGATPTEKVSAVHSHKVVAEMTCSNVQLTHRHISLFAVVAAVFGRMVRVDHGYPACVSSDCGARVEDNGGCMIHNDNSKMCDELK